MAEAEMKAPFNEGDDRADAIASLEERLTGETLDDAARSEILEKIANLEAEAA